MIAAMTPGQLFAASLGIALLVFAFACAVAYADGRWGKR